MAVSCCDCYPLGPVIVLFQPMAVLCVCVEHIAAPTSRQAGVGNSSLMHQMKSLLTEAVCSG